ncbi:hypothetical protein [Tabrizicola sp.]|uniref:hypothetical protein n=1 Tax=Tabrizicola sp. TaxID=2005166 RepID=UPI003F40C54C
MNTYLYLMIAASTVFAAVICYGLARRYGWIAALVLPGLALVAMVGMAWQSGTAGFDNLSGFLGMTAIFAAPTLVGALIGTGIAVWRGR